MTLNSARNPLKAIIFDIGGVIYRAGDGPPLREKWAPKCGLDGDTFDQIVFNSPLYKQAARGEITREQLWAHKNSQLRLSDEDLEAMLVDYWSGYWDGDLLRYIRELSSQFTLGIISDANSGAREVVSQHVDLSLYKSVIFSYEVGASKPDPHIYLAALDGLGLPPADCLFIDDRQPNVDGAIEMGMQAVLYEELRPLQKHITQLTTL